MLKNSVWLGVETRALSSACRMDTREIPAVKAADAAAPQRVLRDMCLSNFLNFPYPKRNYFSTYQHVLLMLSRSRETLEIYPTSV